MHHVSAMRVLFQGGRTTRTALPTLVQYTKCVLYFSSSDRLTVDLCDPAVATVSHCRPRGPPSTHTRLGESEYRSD